MSPNPFFPQPSYERPPCSICGNTMMLARIEPEKPDYDRHVRVRHVQSLEGPCRQIQ
jgi:hypothetical protein